MGLLDWFKGGSGESKIKKYGKKLRNKDTPVEERESIAHDLAEDGSEEAILALLGRFEMTYEHGMKDASEKERVTNLMLGLGDKAVEPLEIFLKASNAFSRPLSIYERLTNPEQAQVLVLELVEAEYKKSGLKPKKKRALLVKLADFKGPNVVVSALRFVDDFDEGCRASAVEVLIAQQETEAIRESLLQRLSGEDEDSSRICFRIAEVAAARSWPLGEHAATISTKPPMNFVVNGGRLVAG
jgi:hypothetical protein